jgi:hypothetical protein
MPNRMEAPEEPEATEPEASTETEEVTETTTEEQPWQLTKDQWEEYQNNQRVLAAATRELYERTGQTAVPQEEEDEEDLDLGTMIQRYVDSRLENDPVRLKQQEEEGKKTLNQLFEQARKDPEIGDFDDDLATRAAHAFFTNEAQGNPQYSQWAAIEGARYAANYRKQERQAGIKEYTEGLSKDTFSDGPAGVGGIRAGKPFASMDEAIEAWSGQEEV